MTTSSFVEAELELDRDATSSSVPRDARNIPERDRSTSCVSTVSFTPGG